MNSISIPVFILISMILSIPNSISGTNVSSQSISSNHGFLLNEISPVPSDAHPWIELTNISGESISPAGWKVEILGSGDMVVMPPDSPRCPPGGFVLIRFSQSSQSVGIGGDTVTANFAKPMNIDSRGDGCVLSEGEVARDAISWGISQAALSSPIPVGEPVMPRYEVYHDDGLFLPDDSIARISTEWLAVSDNPAVSANWAHQFSADASPGASNPPPGPSYMFPEDGTRLASPGYLIAAGMGWAGNVNFQVSDNADFSSLSLDRTTDSNSLSIESVGPGTYYWRARGIGARNGPWSGVYEFTILPYDIDRLISDSSGGPMGLTESGGGHSTHKGKGIAPDIPVMGNERLLSAHVIGLEHIQQRKDTGMLCLDGCPNDGHWVWDRPDAEGTRVGGHHMTMNCVRACLAMIASMAGCTLSQDRISFWIFEESSGSTRIGRETGGLGTPMMDLGHGIGVYSHDAEQALDWIYNQPSGSARALRWDPDLWNDRDPADMDSITEYIDHDRPLIRDTRSHATVVDGYAVILDEHGLIEERFIHVLDPASENTVTWISMLSRSPDNLWIVFPPTSGEPSRCDDPEVKSDSDNDGIVDFDEINRFNTDPNESDTDSDFLTDKIDMLGYLFNPDRSYHLRERDIDRDGNAKELDSDNDHAGDDGVIDGCEDSNRDGFSDVEGDETDNFLGEDDFTVLSPRCFQGFIRLEATAVSPVGSTTTREEMLIQSGQPFPSADFIYDHHWSIESDPITVNAPGLGNFSAMISGSGNTKGSLTVAIGDDGHYRMMTDLNPRGVSYQITSAGRVTDRPLFLGLADHHYEYLSPNIPEQVRRILEASGKVNIFEGDIKTDGHGRRIIRGEDFMTISGEIGAMSGGTSREWQIYLDPEPKP